MKTYYVHGAHNVIDDQTGFKIKSTEARKQWNNLIVHWSHFERRHPMDFLRGFPDNPSVKDPRPDSDPIFVTEDVDPSTF